MARADGEVSKEVVWLRSDFTSNDGQPADVLVAPKVPGEIILIQMDGSCEWKIQKGSYMWCVRPCLLCQTLSWLGCLVRPVAATTALLIMKSGSNAVDFAVVRILRI